MSLLLQRWRREETGGTCFSTVLSLSQLCGEINFTITEERWIAVIRETARGGGGEG